MNVAHPRRALGALFVVAAAACGSDSGQVTTPPSSNPDPINPAPAADTTSLRTYAARRNLFIGTAIDRGFRYSGSDGVTFKQTMTRQFNILTPENDMKFDHLHPTRTTYTVRLGRLVGHVCRNQRHEGAWTQPGVAQPTRVVAHVRHMDQG